MPRRGGARDVSPGRGSRGTPLLNVQNQDLWQQHTQFLEDLEHFVQIMPDGNNKSMEIRHAFYMLESSRQTDLDDVEGFINWVYQDEAMKKYMTPRGHVSGEEFGQSSPLLTPGIANDLHKQKLPSSAYWHVLFMMLERLAVVLLSTCTVGYRNYSTIVLFLQLFSLPLFLYVRGVNVGQICMCICIAHDKLAMLVYCKFFAVGFLAIAAYWLHITGKANLMPAFSDVTLLFEVVTSSVAVFWSVQHADDSKSIAHHVYWIHFRAVGFAKMINPRSPKQIISKTTFFRLLVVVFVFLPCILKIRKWRVVVAFIVLAHCVMHSLAKTMKAEWDHKMHGFFKLAKTQHPTDKDPGKSVSTEVKNTVKVLLFISVILYSVCTVYQFPKHFAGLSGKLHECPMTRGDQSSIFVSWWGYGGCVGMTILSHLKECVVYCMFFIILLPPLLIHFTQSSVFVRGRDQGAGLYWEFRDKLGVAWKVHN